VEAGRSVCRVVVPAYSKGKPSFDIRGKPCLSFGSAWLVSSDLLVTNHHVINSREDTEPDASDTDLSLQAQKAIAQFDYDSEGTRSDDIPIKELMAWSPRGGALDYAILRLSRPALGRRPLALLRTRFELAAGDPSKPAVNIIQHPGRRNGSEMTMYKMLACRNNLVFQTEGPDLWYFTDTLAGSSGSPVCNDAWQVVALHKRWGEVENVNFQGKPTAVANLGTQIYAILADLESRVDLRGLYDEILAVQPGPV
jgi:endonuclease G